ncbi:hypothetical protein G9A89_021599 [Geosiphon pyriformis]|nr:hypothetical protein G9A89_021599 [Geosiphon pyriformis]
MGAPTKQTSENTATSETSVEPKISSHKKTARHIIELGDVTSNNLGQLKRLNSVLFPVHYSEKFYKDVLEVGEFAKLAYFNDACVGGVCCRKEPIPVSKHLKLYIMTLGVLAPYRNLGIGTELLKHILEHANPNKFAEIYLHVQTSNEEALAFYKKYNFQIVGTIEGYYKNITPPDAFILSKKLD